MQSIIVDTNVIVSALISSKGIPAKILDELIIEGKVQVNLSSDIIFEYTNVINRPKFRQYKSFQIKAEIVIGYLSQKGQFSDPKESVEESIDQSDNKFLELALASEAEYLITGNIIHFPSEEFGATKIITPSRYWHHFRPA